MGANEEKGFYKLSWLQRIGFGSGDMAQNLIYQTVSIWLLFFYTNVYGLDPGTAALMFLIVRLVDVLWDPLVGAFVGGICSLLYLLKIYRNNKSSFHKLVIPCLTCFFQRCAMI